MSVKIIKESHEDQPTSIEYKGRKIKLSNDGTGWAIYDSNGDLEDYGYRNPEDAMDYIDEYDSIYQSDYQEYQEDFSNSGSNDTSNKEKSVTDQIKSARFEIQDGSDDNEGLAIAPNGMAAVEYNMSENTFAVRPDNDLALDSQSLPKFKQDIVSCEKLANQLSK